MSLIDNPRGKLGLSALLVAAVAFMLLLQSGDYDNNDTLVLSLGTSEQGNRVRAPNTKFSPESQGSKSMVRTTSPFSVLPDNPNDSVNSAIQEITVSQRLTDDDKSPQNEESNVTAAVDTFEFEQWLKTSLATSGTEDTPDQPVSKDEFDSDNAPDGQTEVDTTDRQDDFGGQLDIRGRVTSKRGRSIAGHKITVEKHLDGKLMMRTVVSASNGVFLIRNLIAGDYIVRAEESEQYAPRTMRARAGSSPFEMVLLRRGSAVVHGTVTDEVGLPVPDVIVIPPVADEQGATDEEGRFSFEITALDGQGLLLRYEADGYLPDNRYFAPEQWITGKNVLADMQLRKTGELTISGTVLSEQGYPIEKALVQITSRTKNFHKSIDADEAGFFSLDGVLPANDYTLRISSNVTYETFIASDLSLSNDIADMHVTLRYAPMGRLSGTIVDAIGTPVPQMSLLALSSELSGRSATISSDDFGEFVLDGFVAGGLTFRSQAPPNIAIQGVTLSSSDDTSVTFVVDMGEYALSGVVTNSVGLSVPEAQVTMKVVHNEYGLLSTTTRSTKSDLTGAFEFTGLGAGERSIVAVAKNYTTEKLSVDPARDPGPHMITLLQ